MIEANNGLYESATSVYKKRVGELQAENQTIKTQYESDVQAKSQLFDTEKQRADDQSDQVNSLAATNDQLNAEKSTMKATHQKEQRTLLREVSAWKGRAIAEKVTREVAIKEDPSDGEVLYADRRTRLVFINRGRNFHVGNGMRFTVWRTGKGGVREDIAVIRVIGVEKTSAKCNIVSVKNRRVPISQGMQISNPFYDPHKRLRVYISGNLRYYSSDLAKRRLAESGADVTDRLDDRVNVIVLGTPAVSMPTDDGDEEGMAAAKARAATEREKRLRDVRQTAVTLGAIVVTENVLRTFISY